MARPRKDTVQLVVPNSPEIDNTISVENTLELIKPEIVETPKQETIHDKYRKYINQAKSNFLHNLSYGESMEILRWVEKKTGNSMSMNTSCATCMINLIKLFSNLEGK